MNDKPQSDRISKDHMYMLIAGVVAQRSTCSRLKVGAVITDPDKKNVLAYGFNGNYAGGPNTCDSHEPGQCGCIHAELNAIIKEGYYKGAILYTTDSPCVHCAKSIINAGIEQIFYRNEYRLTDGIELLKSANVLVTKI